MTALKTSVSSICSSDIAIYRLYRLLTNRLIGEPLVRALIAFGAILSESRGDQTAL
jgi:hypothetical protein